MGGYLRGYSEKVKMHSSCIGFALPNRRPAPAQDPLSSGSLAYLITVPFMLAAGCSPDTSTASSRERGRSVGRRLNSRSFGIFSNPLSPPSTCPVKRPSRRRRCSPRGDARGLRAVHPRQCGRRASTDRIDRAGGPLGCCRRFADCERCPACTRRSHLPRRLLRAYG